MLSPWVHDPKRLRVVAAALFLAASLRSGLALDQPTGAPLQISSVETEQGVPLAVLSPDGKKASCVTVRLHWSPQQNAGADADSTSFTLDIAADSPGAPIFIAQLWNASLASALAWQQPWEGARWKILDTPATNGTGIDAALAVGMIATSARRPYPKDTLVIGSLEPDGSLGAVSRLSERLDAAAAAGITRVIIPSVQRFDVDDSGQVLNMVRHANDLHLDCIPVDDLVEATQTVMNDPLPEITLSPSTPKYGNDVATYIDSFARREQDEVDSDLAYGPKEADLSKYPPRIAAIWKSIYADNETGQQAYRAGQVYTAYRFFERINGRMHGVNALTDQNTSSFDVKSSLAEADDLLRQVHDLVTPPSIDKDDLESGVLVSEMADWAYDISAELEGAELVTKQTFSQRTDATQAQKDRAREAILFANEEAKYLLTGSDFYTGLLIHIDANPISADENAGHLLPQLIPAQLAMAEIFTQGIRSRANALRDGLLFDPRLAAYVRVLRETEMAWDARQRKKDLAVPTPQANPAASSTKLDASTTGSVGFDPGNTYAPPHTVLATSDPSRKLSDVAACLIWVNNDCEIATLDQKYLRLSGTVDPVTHVWHVKDRAKLDALLQSAESGARIGISFAEKAEIDTSVLDMIYERASQLRIQGEDTDALEALRNYWRCGLLGNMCWQLAHTHKAQPVNLADAKTGKTTKKETKPASDKSAAVAKAVDSDHAGDSAKNHDVVDTAPSTPKPDDAAGSDSAETPGKDTTTDSSTAAAPAPSTNDAAASSAPPPEPPAPAPAPSIAANPDSSPPVAEPSSTDDSGSPRALPVSDDPAAAPLSNGPSATPPPPPANPPAPTPVPAANPSPDDANIPVAPVARSEDLTGNDAAASPATNAAPLIGPQPPAPAPAPAPVDKSATGGD